MKTIPKSTVLSLFAHLVENNNSAETIRQFLRSRFDNMVDTVKASGDHASPLACTLDDLINTHRLLTASGILPSGGPPWPLVFSKQIRSAPVEVKTWLATVSDGQVLMKGVLLAGTGIYLDFLDAAGQLEYQSFVRDNLEKLLRHVEVRRHDCLQQIFPATNTDNQWLEKHDIAILFCRHAKRTGDLRMLNAALKLNDWAFPMYRKQPPGVRLARYLLALAEQEYCMQELMN